MNLFKTLLVLVLCAATAFAEESSPLQALDRAATEAYRAQEYDLAEQQWNSALALDEVQASSSERARILHNLGNVSLRGGDALEAVARYRSSLKLRPRDADTWANLDFARSEANLDPAPRAGFLSSLTLAETERLVLFLALALFLMLVGEAFLGGAFGPASVVAGLLLLGSLFPWAGRVAGADAEEAMVIKRAGTALRSEPRTGAASLIRLEPGTEHRVRDQLPDWISVETPDGVEGWVKAADLLRTTR